MSSLESVAFVLGVLNVWLAVRRSVWNFPVGIAAVTLIAVLVVRQRLYSDALLQIFFVVANVYGWVKWRQAEARTQTIPVERMSANAIGWWLAGWAAASVGWAWATAEFTDAARPWWDAPTFTASIAAQILMGQRRLENWVVWIAVDLALIPLYAVQHLYGLAALYVVYLILSVWGLADWRRAYLGACPDVAAA